MKHSTLDTPAGPLTVVVSDAGAVRAAGFTANVDQLMPLVHPSLRQSTRTSVEDPTRTSLGDPARPSQPSLPTRPGPDLGAVTAAVRSYLDGDLTALDAVPVEQHTDGAFLGHAWHVMRDIKPGAPITYTGFAALAGRPAAVRAAAAACARNAVALFVPCHRVLRTDGTLGGYRWGLPVKRWLLEHESRWLRS